MRLFRLILLATLPLVASGSYAVDNVENGKALYGACAACHGARGGGNVDLGAPRLSHLSQVYVAAQLQKFKAGIRGGEGSSAAAAQMAAMAATLADEQSMYDVAAYISSLDAPASAATVQANIELGGDYYNQFCGACHGPAAQGNPALNSPPLAGADDWYLTAQMNAFREGARGAHPQDKTGRQMRMMAGVLPDDQSVADVVAFIRSLEE